MTLPRRPSPVRRHPGCRRTPVVRRLPSVILSSVLLASVVLPPPASGTPPPPATVTPPSPSLPSRPANAAITSSDRRFRVIGLSSAENLRLAESLSALSRSLETRLGLSLPFRRGDAPVSIQIPVSPDAPADWLAVQSWSDGFPSQRLATPPPAAIDPEDLATRVVSLLLTRCAALSRPPGTPPSATPAPPPDWLAAGLAQLLDPATLARDRSYLRDAPSAPPSLRTILSWTTLPDGRWADKAYAAAAADTAFPPSSPDLWRAYFRAAAASSVRPRWFLEHTSLPAPADWPSALARWAAPPDDSTLVFDTDDPDRSAERRLVETLDFDPADFLPSPPPPGLPERLFAGALDSWRDAPWLPTLATSLSLHVQSLKLGATQPLRAVLDAYAAYFDALAVPPPPPEKPHWWSRSKPATPPQPAIRPPDPAIRSLWTRAETIHRDYLARRQTLRDYVTSWERRTAPPEPSSPPPSPPRTPIHLYLDSFPVPP